MDPGEREMVDGEIREILKRLDVLERHLAGAHDVAGSEAAERMLGQTRDARRQVEDIRTLLVSADDELAEELLDRLVEIRALIEDQQEYLSG
jgi:hypothetical protein